MSYLRSFAQRIRHMPGLEKAEGLWRIVRKPYHKALSIGGRGVSVRVGRIANIRMPAEFAGGSWDAHEPETVRSFTRWVQGHRDGLVLDIGSSVGIFSAVALFANPTATVTAFDPDLSSLAAVQRLCQYASGSRLQLVRCFVSDRSSAPVTIADAASMTERELSRAGVSGDVGTTRYIALNDEAARLIPTYKLDDLLVDEMASEPPLLIKCDVEGAELKVLQGAEKSIQRIRPTLALSVHPQTIRDYGGSRDKIADFLGAFGYKIEIIGVDHEEHWWCEFNKIT